MGEQTGVEQVGAELDGRVAEPSLGEQTPGETSGQKNLAKTGKHLEFYTRPQDPTNVYV